MCPGARAIGAGMPMGTRSCVASDLRCWMLMVDDWSSVLHFEMSQRLLERSDECAGILQGSGAKIQKPTELLLGYLTRC